MNDIQQAFETLGTEIEKLHSYAGDLNDLIADIAMELKAGAVQNGRFVPDTDKIIPAIKSLKTRLSFVR